MGNTAWCYRWSYIGQKYSIKRTPFNPYTVTQSSKGRNTTADNIAVRYIQIKENPMFISSLYSLIILNGFLWLAICKRCSLCSLYLEWIAINFFLVLYLYFECEKLVALEYRVKLARSYERLSINICSRKKTPQLILDNHLSSWQFYLYLFFFDARCVLQQV